MFEKHKITDLQKKSLLHMQSQEGLVELCWLMRESFSIFVVKVIPVEHIWLMNRAVNNLFILVIVATKVDSVLSPKMRSWSREGKPSIDF